MNLKRIFAAVVCAAMLVTNSLAFTEPAFDEAFQNVKENSDTVNENTSESQSSTDASEDNYQLPPPGSVIGAQVQQYMRPSDYYYTTFRQILELYVKSHLYETTEEEVMFKLIEKMLESNPNYFKFLVNYMLSTMDPYSSYHELSSHFLDVENASTGYGIVISDSDGKIVITDVVSDSSADKAGLKPGDILISIGDYDVENLPKEAAIIILQRPYIFFSKKDESGSYTDYNPECTFTVERDGQKITLSMKKDSYTQKQFSASLTQEGKTAYVSISSFLGTDMDKDFNKLIYGYAADGIKNLTIDLRDNGGGSLEYALSMVETFVDNGELLCYYNERNLEEPEPVYSTTPKASFDSITILVNKNTASAAELFTSILQTKQLAKVVGERTYGKSVGQSVYYLANGDYITITTYEMLDENLESYNAIGIIPDIEIENVELLYTLPLLGTFNHQNYTEIKEGEYSDVTRALEDRLVILGYMYPEYSDGIFDETTATALKIYQAIRGIEPTGTCTFDTVTKITASINSYKYYTYYEDSQYDVAMIIHSSFSQGKRLASEKKQLAEKHKKLIEEREAAIEAELDALEQASE